MDDLGDSIIEKRLEIRDDIIATVLNLAERAWPLVCRRSDVTCGSDEPSIAGALRQEILKICDAAEIDLDPGTEVAVYTPERLTASGFIDFAFKDTWLWGKRGYFGMECKRVSGKDSGLAREYVNEGIHRFVEKGKYSPHHSHASMAGFVIDGNVRGSVGKITGYLRQKKKEMQLSRKWQRERGFGRHRHLYSTSHIQEDNGNVIMILHLFLPWVTKN